MKSHFLSTLMISNLFLMTAPEAADKVLVNKVSPSQSLIQVQSPTDGLSMTLFEVMKLANEVNDRSYGVIKYRTTRNGDHTYFVSQRNKKDLISATLKRDGTASASIIVNTKEVQIDNVTNKVLMLRAAAEQLHSLLNSTYGVQREPIIVDGRAVGEKQTADANYKGKGIISCVKTTFIPEYNIGKISAKCRLNFEK